MATLPFGTLLVPVDFSPPSIQAADRAFLLASGEAPVVILVHVIDSMLVEFAVQHGWGDAVTVTDSMRQRAEREMQHLKSRAPDDISVDTIISQGTPFLDILRKADEFAVDAIVVGKSGGKADLEKLMFGSTAEKLLRASHHPVLVLPGN